jgi:hypothetical protein
VRKQFNRIHVGSSAKHWPYMERAELGAFLRDIRVPMTASEWLDRPSGALYLGPSRNVEG